MTTLSHVTFAYALGEGEGAPRSGGVMDIDLEFAPGQFVLITGPSGCGKSTILKLLNGLIPELFSGDLSGKVTLAGHETTSTDIQSLGRCAGMVFQNPRSQFFTANVIEELAFASENAGEAPEVIARRIEDAADTWALADFLDRDLTKLSGGQAQLVASAVATAGPQHILLLDEPTSNLSVEMIGRFAAALGELKGRGWTIVCAEHRVYPFREIADRVVRLAGGRVVEVCGANEFYSRSDVERRAMGLRTLKAPDAGILGEGSDRSGTTAAVVADNLTFSYGDREVLDIDSLTLYPGQVTSLEGPNGAGKTTLARVLIGLADASAGRISFAGKDAGKHMRQARSVLVMQDVNRQLFGQSVRAEMRIGGVEVSDERIDGVLAALDLNELADRHPMTLSGGQKQRLVIACSLVADKELYVFDEPTSGVDYAQLRSISEEIRALAARGKTVLIISHDLEFIDEVADRRLWLDTLTDARANDEPQIRALGTRSRSKN